MATPKNVYELAQERLDVIFREFDTICVSFSGGKDSGVLLNLCIDYIRRNRLNRKLCVFHMDYEIQYSMTIDYVDRVLEANKDILEVYSCLCAFPCNDLYVDVPELLASVAGGFGGHLGKEDAERLPH